jgi:hypothetical protein
MQILSKKFGQVVYAPRSGLCYFEKTVSFQSLRPPAIRTHLGSTRPALRKVSCVTISKNSRGKRAAEARSLPDGQLEAAITESVEFLADGNVAYDSA